MRPQTDHTHYTAAVHQALLEGEHPPEAVITVQERTGLRRSLFHLEGLRLRWEEEKGWSADFADGETWHCHHPAVCPPNLVAQWVHAVLVRDEGARGVEHRRPSDSELEARLAAYIAPSWRSDPDPAGDPAWT